MWRRRNRKAQVRNEQDPTPIGKKNNENLKRPSKLDPTTWSRMADHEIGTANAKGQNRIPSSTRESKRQNTLNSTTRSHPNRHTMDRWSQRAHWRRMRTREMAWELQHQGWTRIRKELAQTWQKEPTSQTVKDSSKNDRFIQRTNWTEQCHPDSLLYLNQSPKKCRNQIDICTSRWGEHPKSWYGKQTPLGNINM